MAGYKVVFRRSVSRDFRSIPNADVRRILKRIERLAEDPRTPGAEKLTGDKKYRIRQGHYRILYTVEDDIVTVVTVKIGHRRDVYR